MRTITFIFLAFLLSGCSVGMALSGKETPDMTKMQTRKEVERQIGYPVASTPLRDGGSIDTYEYESGNDASGGRAVGHAAMDVLTLGLWEVVGTPVEGFVGEKRNVQVYYDREDHVRGIKELGAVK